MDKAKRKKLEAAGWRFGTAEEFVGLPKGSLAKTTAPRKHLPSRREFYERYACAHCEARPPRGDYMVRDAVWAAAGMDRGFLCLSCLETRLIAAGYGQLTIADFTDVPGNAGLLFGYALALRTVAAAVNNLASAVSVTNRRSSARGSTKAGMVRRAKS
jgi:hypothetical protein